MAESIDLAAKTPWTLVRFVHAGGSKNVTNRDSDYSSGGLLYESIPEVTVSLPENDGLLADSPCTIELPLEPDPDLTERLTNGAPHAPVTVEVTEIVRGDAEQATASTNTFTVFKGLVVNARRNVNGRKDIVSIQALPLKARMRTISLGLPCNHQCIHQLGDAGCKVDMSSSPRKLTAAITDISGSQVTVDSIPSSLGDRFYQRGYMEFQGLNILIRDWRDEIAGNKLVFFLADQPPAHWDGEDVTIRAGCDKSQETCDVRFSNLDNFAGIGFAIPAYGPMWEDGGENQ